jgi:hypothetical protein
MGVWWREEKSSSTAEPGTPTSPPSPYSSQQQSLLTGVIVPAEDKDAHRIQSAIVHLLNDKKLSATDLANWSVLSERVII